RVEPLSALLLRQCRQLLPELSRRGSGRGAEGLELVPPEVTVRADVAGSHENRVRETMRLENWLGDQEVVAVPVVERDDHATSQRLPAGHCMTNLGEREDPKAVLHQFHLLSEEVRGDAQIPGIGASARDAVVHQDDRLPLLIAPAAA